MPTSEQIHSIIDRHRAAALALLRIVPALCPLPRRYASALERMGHRSHRAAILGPRLHQRLRPAASPARRHHLRRQSALRRRAPPTHRADIPSEADAARSAESLTTLVGLFKSIQQMQPRNNGDKAFLQTIDSLKLEQRRDRAILTATVPIELLQQLVGSTSPSSSVAQPVPPANMTAPASP